MTQKTRHFLRYRLPAMLWAVGIFIGSSFPSVSLPHMAFLAGDKVLHVAVYFVFSILMYRALEPNPPRNGFNWKRVVIAAVVVIVYGILDEVHQMYVPGRRVDILDVVANATGAFVALGVTYVVSWKKSARFRGTA